MSRTSLYIWGGVGLSVVTLTMIGLRYGTSRKYPSLTWYLFPSTYRKLRRKAIEDYASWLSQNPMDKIEYKAAYFVLQGMEDFPQDVEGLKLKRTLKRIAKNKLALPEHKLNNEEDIVKEVKNKYPEKYRKAKKTAATKDGQWMWRNENFKIGDIKKKIQKL